jgi:hypothetical protein
LRGALSGAPFFLSEFHTATDSGIFSAFSRSGPFQQRSWEPAPVAISLLQHPEINQQSLYQRR